MSFNSLSRIIQDNLCCGCSSCVNSCPEHLITMEEDVAGFLYPILKYPEKCIACDNCNKSCPLICSTYTPKKFSESIPYQGYVNNTNILISCSSGGIATALSTTIIENGGSVFGVRYSQDFTKVVYSRAQTINELDEFKGSKYIQPEMGSTFIKIKKELDTGKLLLFIGLPCIVAGLKTFLKKEYGNLITCDLICYGVTSPKISADYIHHLCNKYMSRLTKFSVRYKKRGIWLPSYIRAEFANNKVHIEPYNLSDYGWGFTMFSRPSCYQCSCKYKGSSADLTLGDAHGCSKNEAAWNPHGISVIFIHTAKGSKYLDKINGVSLFKTTYINASNGNPYLVTSHKKSKNYYKFSKYLTTKNLQTACNKTYPLHIKIVRKLPPIIIDVITHNKLLQLIYKKQATKKST